MTEQEIENWESLDYRIDAEGFDYCFESYSHWTEIKDEEFHKLRKAYLDAMEQLQDYVSNKVSEARKYE